MSGCSTRPAPEERIAAVFDWLHEWFSEPDYRGCAFINAFGEMGAVSPEVAARARHHTRGPSTATSPSS